MSTSPASKSSNQGIFAVQVMSPTSPSPVFLMIQADDPESAAAASVPLAQEHMGEHAEVVAVFSREHVVGILAAIDEATQKMMASAT